jgi:TonB family protein
MAIAVALSACARTYAPAPDRGASGDFFVFDKAPKLTSFVRPEDPGVWPPPGRDPVVVVKITVDEHGAVESASVLDGLGPGFDEAATTAVRQWTFEPAQQDGAPVKGTITVPLEFPLPESDGDR